ARVLRARASAPRGVRVLGKDRGVPSEAATPSGLTRRSSRVGRLYHARCTATPPGHGRERPPAWARPVGFFGVARVTMTLGVGPPRTKARDARERGRAR